MQEGDRPRTGVLDDHVGCSRSRRGCGCCSSAPVPAALYAFFPRRLGGRRPLGSCAAAHNINKALPVSIFLGCCSFFSPWRRRRREPAWKGFRRRRRRGPPWKGSSSPWIRGVLGSSFPWWRRGVHGGVHGSKTLRWSSRRHAFRYWLAGRDNPCLRLCRCSLIEELIQPLFCSSILCSCSRWRVVNRCRCWIESRR